MAAYEDGKLTSSCGHTKLTAMYGLFSHEKDLKMRSTTSPPQRTEEPYQDRQERERIWSRQKHSSVQQHTE